MVSLEQVKLLETKVARAIDYVERVTEENTILREKLDSYQKRIGELEVLVQHFKEDQGRIEDGILSALDRLNQFEDAIEKSLAARGGADLPAEAPAPAPPPPETETAGEDSTGEDSAGEDGENTETSADNGELDIF
jgi:FtsZ-binding cell division protein ZapB